MKPCYKFRTYIVCRDLADSNYEVAAAFPPHLAYWLTGFQIGRRQFTSKQLQFTLKMRFQLELNGFKRLQGLAMSSFPLPMNLKNSFSLS
jgi:hypothetical protein